MTGCCVQVQCTVSNFSIDHILAEMMSSGLVNTNGMHVVPICMLWSIGGQFHHVHCTLCEEEEDEPNSGVQQCSAVFEVMQNVSTLQEFTACCL